MSMTSSTNRNGRRERGQAALEGTFIILIVLGFLIGTLDFAQFLYFHQSLVERARAAARYGAVHPTDSTGTVNVALYNTAAPSDGANPLVPNLTSSMVGVNTYDSGTSNARVVVTISNYSFRFFSPLIAGAATAKPIIATAIAEESSAP